MIGINITAVHSNLIYTDAKNIFKMCRQMQPENVWKVEKGIDAFSDWSKYLKNLT